jgi:hypothetical protein
MNKMLRTKFLIVLILFGNSIHAGEIMDDFQFGKIERSVGEIYQREWDKVIQTDSSLEQVEDKKGVNPFTNAEVIFPGEGKAYYIESGDRVGNISLEGGVLLTTGVPKKKCEQIGTLLKALVSKDDRS